MAFTQASFCLSSDTPSTVKFLSLYVLYAFTTFGFSMRQGWHQLAQKSTNTYLPLNEERLTGLPLVSGREKSGAALGFIMVFTSARLVCCGNREAASPTSFVTSA